MKFLLRIVAFFALASVAVGFGGFISVPNIALIALAVTPTAGETPLVTSYVVTIDSLDGRPLEDLTFVLECDDGTLIQSPTNINGEMIDADTAEYQFENTCTSVATGTRVAGVRIMWRGVDLQKEITTNITVTPVVTLPEISIFAAVPTQETCVLPCENQQVTALALNQTPPLEWKVDHDDSCASSTTDCTDPCWEATLGTDQLLLQADVANFTGAGLKQLRICVVDAAPSAAYAQVPFTAESSSVALACTASATPSTSVVSPLNNVALSVDCIGDIVDAGIGADLTFCCTEDCPSGSTTTLYTNTFDTAGCAEATSQTGTRSCGGGTASVGSGGSGSHFYRFDSKWTSETDMRINIDDLVIATDSASANQTRFALRTGGADTGYRIRSISPTNRNLRFTCGATSGANAGSCDTGNNVYTVGVPLDLAIRISDTASGASDLEDGAGNVLCHCAPAGGGPYPADGFLLGGATAVINFGGVTVEGVGVGSPITPVSGNTTWPFDTQVEAGENCDGYTALSQNAKVTINFPDAEPIPLLMPIQVTPAPTFAINSIALNLGTSCTLPDCLLDEITLNYTGSAIGTVSAIGCTLVNGTEPAILTTTTDAATPFTLTAEGGWTGFDYQQAGTYQIQCSATREGVTANQTVQLLVNNVVTPVTDLVSTPSSIIRTTTPGGTVTSETVVITDTLGGALPFNCIESPPVSWLSLNSCCSTTPATLTLTYATSTLASGTYDTNLICTNEATPTDTATTAVRVTVSTPTAGDPTWSAGRDGSGNLLVYTGTIGSSPTVTIKPAFDNAFGTTRNRFVNSDDEPSLATESHVLRNSRLAGGVTTSNNKDVVQINWGANRKSYYWLLKSLDLYGAWFTATGPHGDTLQTFCVLPNGTGCTGPNNSDYTARAIVAQNVYALTSDSGQLWWNTGHADIGADHFDWFVIQESYFGTTVDGVAACNARRAASNCTASACTFNCSAKRINLPNNGAGAGLTDIWLIDIDGAPSFEGGNSATPSTQNLIMIPPNGGTCATPTSVPYNVTSSFLSVGRRHCFNTINAALAAGWAEPPFVRLACGGWANPAVDAPGCISGYGYVPSN
jgi:hypothetical protein